MSDMADVRASSNGDDPAYSYKASLVGAAFEFACAPTGWNGVKAGARGARPTAASSASGCRFAR